MKTHRILKDTPDAQSVNALKEALGVPRIIAHLLVQRGVTNFDEAKAFFRPSMEELHDPYLMRGMKEAVDRVSKALLANEPILVYGDYDVDGTTAVSLMVRFLGRINEHVSYYIPDRYTEGYGISETGIRYAHEKGCKLVIALDCGIRAVDKVELANSLGIDMIICDHHLPGEQIPDALAVLDPKQPGCEYPYKELSGCAIGYKLASAVAKKFAVPDVEMIQLLDLVVISLACDIVPLTGENRVLAHMGLKKIRTLPNGGIRALFGEAFDLKHTTVSDIVFKVGPKINAAGRLRHGSEAVELLTTSDSETIERLAKQLNSRNEERKQIDKTITSEALLKVSGNADDLNAAATVVFDPNWHKGVVGIVASRLMEHYYRPTLVLTLSDGMITGSARSVKGVDVHEALHECADLLDRFGGHKYAAGLSLRPEKYDAFKSRFIEVIESKRVFTGERAPVSIDARLNFHDFSVEPGGVAKINRILKQMEPFGPGNMTPVFQAEDAIDNGGSGRIGSDKSHLRLTLSDEGGRQSFKGVAFGKGDYLDMVQSGDPLSIAYSIAENHWRGQTEIQLMVRDIALTDAQRQK